MRSPTQIGIANLLEVAGSHLGFVTGTPLLKPTTEFAARWGALDDGEHVCECVLHIERHESSR